MTTCQRTQFGSREDEFLLSLFFENMYVPLVPVMQFENEGYGDGANVILYLKIHERLTQN